MGTVYGFVSFYKESDAIVATKKMNGIVIFNHKLLVKKSYVNSNKISDNDTFPIAKNTKKLPGIWISKSRNNKGFTYAEVVKGKAPAGDTYTGTSKNGRKKEESSQEVYVTHVDLENQISVLRSVHLEQDMRIADLVLMCMAFKNELDSWKGRREGQSETGNNAENKEEVEVEMGSKVSDTVFEDNFEPQNKDIQEQVMPLSRTGRIVGEFSNKDGRVREETLDRDETTNRVNGEGAFLEEEKMKSVEKVGAEEEEGVRINYMGMEGRIHTEEDISDSTTTRSPNSMIHNKRLFGINKKRIAKAYRSSLRINHLGSILITRDKKRVSKSREYPKSCSEEEDVSSRTVSLETEKGNEYFNKICREAEESKRAEAIKIVETGIRIGVSFDPNPMEAIEKVVAMEKIFDD